MTLIAWGKPTWSFFHTLACNVNESSFPMMGASLIAVIQTTCKHLPCPDCTKHAGEFWSKVKTNNIRTKQDLIDLLFMFHNMVNHRKSYEMFTHDQLAIYETKNVIQEYNEFVKHFNTRGNMNYISESFHRNMMLTSLRAWIVANIHHFTLV